MTTFQERLKTFLVGPKPQEAPEPLSGFRERLGSFLQESPRRGPLTAREEHQRRLLEGGALPTEEIREQSRFSTPGGLVSGVGGGIVTGAGEIIKESADVPRLLAQTMAGKQIGDLFGAVTEPVVAPVREFGESVRSSGIDIRAEAAAGVSSPVASAAIQGVGALSELGTNLIPLEAAARPALAASRAARAGKGLSTEVSDAFRKKYFLDEPEVLPGKESVDRAAAKVYNAMLNELAPVERIGKRVGGQFARDVEVAAQAARVATRSARSPVHSATRTLGPEQRITGPGLRDIGRSVDRVAEGLGEPRRAVQQDFENLLAARRELELGKRGVSQSKEARKDALGLIKDLRKKYGSTPGGGINFIDRLGTEFRNWSNRAFLDKLEEVGVFSRAERKAIEDSNEFYAPFIRAMQRLDERGENLSVAARPGTPVKNKKITQGLVPGEGRLEPILDIAADRATRVHIWATHQKLKNMLGEAARRDPEIAKEIFPSSRGKHAIYEGGERKPHEMPDDVIKALDGLDLKESSLVIQAARSFTDLKRAGATLTLRFGARNVVRDPLAAAVVSPNGQIPFLSAARAMVDLVFSKATGRGLTRQDWQDFADSGTVQATLTGLERRTPALELEAAREAASGLGTLRSRTKAFIKDPLYPLKVLASYSETPGRFAEFRLARRKGKTIGEAALDAADTPINFSRMGSVGRVWNSFEAFSNVMLQDPDRLIRAMGERPWATAAKGLAYLTAPALGNWAWNRNNPDWRELPEVERRLFWQVAQLGPNGEGGRFIRFPLPPGLISVMFSTLPQMAMDYFANERGGEEVARDMVMAMVDDTPLRFTPATMLDPDQEGQKDFILDILPDAVQPLVELRANRNAFANRPAVAERFVRTGFGAPLPEERFTEYTSRVGKILGQTEVGARMGGPVAVDFLISAYAAGLGRDIAAITSDPEIRNRIRTGVPGSVRGIPVAAELVGAFISTSPVGFGSTSVREFYRLRDRAMQAKSSAGLKESSVQQEGVWIHNPELRYVKEMNAHAKELGRLADTKRGYMNDSTLSDAQRTDLLLAVDQNVTKSTALFMEGLRAQVVADLTEWHRNQTLEEAQ